MYTQTYIANVPRWGCPRLQSEVFWEFGLGVAVLCVLLRAYQIKRLCV
jgi:hypothetical protein